MNLPVRVSLIIVLAVNLWILRKGVVEGLYHRRVERTWDIRREPVYVAGRKAVVAGAVLSAGSLAVIVAVIVALIR